MEKGNVIVTRDGKNRGNVTTGFPVNCRLEGCRGLKYHVTWLDGKRSYVCTKGLKEISTHVFQLM